MIVEGTYFKGDLNPFLIEADEYLKHLSRYILAKYYKCSSDQILARGKKTNLPRDIAIYIARQTSGKSTVELGVRFGGVKGHSITMRCGYVEKVLERDKKIKKAVNRLLNND